MQSGPFFRIEATETCGNETFDGILNVECAVFLPLRSVVAIPENATAIASFPVDMTFASIMLI